MKLLIVLMMFSMSVYAYDENPNALFSTSKNFTNKSTIVWEQADDANKACNDASFKYGNNGFAYKVDACSFWNKNKKGEDVCRIITAKSVSMATIGHEMRHCFQGQFHK